MGFCSAWEKTNVFLFLHQAKSASLKDNLKKRKYFLRFLVQDGRLKSWPCALPWRWLLSIQPLPHPRSVKCESELPEGFSPPEDFDSCIRWGSRLAIVCCYFIIHLPFSCFTAEYLFTVQLSFCLRCESVSNFSGLVRRQILFIIS